ncbi:hypothetical protein BW730_07340 [Tessaracoccus aquimaris]|uniref:P-type ATPase A domain-containing protein n=1 Tax=Tessaracoccus aquimaris TaxID=1332264 RepID=A0A1Q2CMJ1_9ACTN|nr:cation-translocating P-type ATPase [Tessaracoccus aquimaris]AQP47341.1 hypothetical protein BW730_07340 [Tessaracoccus aquimaris]
MNARDALTASSGALLIAALAAHVTGASQVAAVLLSVSALLSLGPIARRALRALRVRAFSIDLLVTIAIVGALIIGEATEAAVVGFLFLFGAWLEARTLERTRRSLLALVALAPTRATIDRDGGRVAVDVEDVLPGERVIVTTGERIAVDGTVLTGDAWVDESTLTGEPSPVHRVAGERVRAATLLTSGYLEVEAELIGAETTYGRIIDLVEEAQESRTRRQRFLERFARYYTPGVLLASLLVFALTRDVEFALVFLVIACPGALVISVPVAAVAGLGAIARQGVLIKSGEALEALASADTLVVDKTGTLTLGRPAVTEVVAEPGVARGDVLESAAAVESASEHPLGAAIVAAARTRGLPLGRPEDIYVLTGAGISGRHEGRRIAVGTPDFVTEFGAPPGVAALTRADRLEEEGASVVFVADERRLLGLIAIADQPRAEAADAIRRLRAAGIERVVALSGDADGPTRRVAEALGVDEAHGRLLPADKAAAVADLQASGRTVVMLGDGVNDAPALARADVGVAMGVGGTDASVETADVVLLGDRLDQFAHARRVARATVRVMRQNTALALATVAVLLVGVLSRDIGLAGGMLVHEASVLLVIVNALRLTRMRGPAATEASRLPLVEEARR